MIGIYDLTKKYGTVNSLGKVKNAHAARGRVRIFSGITQCLMSNGGYRGVMGWEDLK